MSKGHFAARIRELATGQQMLEAITDAMLAAREALLTEFMHLHRLMLTIARADPVCRRLMTAPGVGALVSITFKTALDEPGRSSSSKTVGAYFGLTPKRYQFWRDGRDRRDQQGGRCDGAHRALRTANAVLSRPIRFSALKRWAMDVAKRRGQRRAKVALARKLGTVLHRMWVDGTEFRWNKAMQVAG